MPNPMLTNDDDVVAQHVAHASFAVKFGDGFWLTTCSSRDMVSFFRVFCGPNLCAGFALSLCTVFAPIADACSLAPPQHQVSVPGQVPQNGLIVMGYACDRCSGKEGALEVAVKNERGEIVPGALIAEQYADLLIWQANAAFEDTGKYTLELSGTAYELESHPIDVTAPVDSDDLQLGAAVTAKSWIKFEGPEFCCPNPDADSCSSTERCGIVPETLVTMFDVGVSIGPSDFAAKNLFVFNLQITKGDEVVETGWSGRPPAYRTFTEAPNYCVELSARYLPTGEESVRYQGCIRQEQILAPKVDELLDQQLHRIFDECDDHGEYEELWCDIHQDSVDAGVCEGKFKDSDACEAALERCGTQPAGSEAGCRLSRHLSSAPAPLSSLLLLALLSAAAAVRRRTQQD